ncbi:hypothetical protein ANANG_G00126360 [Anguilla anguilla]|uniref:Uncharacterized protein n=1 Tax=Anguilla anguilla TaxID=7936 RepID=A0A9D3RZW0_ANGAN|nr:hypothetical protein ANANG_G00126360 [Anguilla anguilla]
MALGEVWARVKNVCKQNGLLILSVLAVIIGCLLGFFLRARHLSEQVSVQPASPPSPSCGAVLSEWQLSNAPPFLAASPTSCFFDFALDGGMAAVERVSVVERH